MLDTGRAQLRFKVRGPLPPGHVSSGSFVIVRVILPYERGSHYQYASYLRPVYYRSSALDKVAIADTVLNILALITSAAIGSILATITVTVHSTLLVTCFGLLQLPTPRKSAVDLTTSKLLPCVQPTT